MSRTRVLVLLCLGFMPCVFTVNAEREVVLVAAANSPLRELNGLELRKIYLGFPVTRDGNAVKGLRNTGDSDLNRIFLQTVVAMSEKSYARRLLTLAVRQGIPRPPEYDNVASLTRALAEHPYSVSYMWKDAALKSPDVRILKVLWHQ